MASDEVGDDIVLKNLIKISLEAVQNLTAHWHDGLEFRVTSLLTRAECGITLDDVQLTARSVLGAAVNELLHAVGHVQTA